MEQNFKDLPKELPTVKNVMEHFGIDNQKATEALLDYFIEIIYPELYKLKEKLEKLTQQKEIFQHNMMYVEVVEDVITNKETEWENKTFNNMLVKLVGKDEVYKVFVQTNNSPVSGSRIKFIYNADENKLSKLKII